MTQKSKNPFRVPLSNRWLAGLIESVLGLTPLVTRYDARPKQDLTAPDTGKVFLDHTLNSLDISVNVECAEKLEQIPSEGPVIFVANHPLGGLEGVAMTRELLKVRPDTKVLTNLLLTNIDELSSLFIGVDVLSKDAAKANAKGIREVCKHLGKGGALLIYPAGQVSAINTDTWKIEDRTWDTTVGRLVKRYEAPVMPFFVKGKNSSLFYLLGLIHRRLRTIMLPRELSNKRGGQVSFIAGNLIPFDEMKACTSDQEVTSYLRIATEFIPKGKSQRSMQVREPKPFAEQSVRSEAEAYSLEHLVDYQLIEQNNFTVYCAPYEKLGWVMNAIARAREITFRAAGEGTGNEIDSDEFDPRYEHLFVWDKDKNAIVGGYRMGRVDEIVSRYGIKALYSRSLYKFDLSYLQKLGNPLEVGRSFVSAEYQRHPRALDLLWKGIGNFIARHPQYSTLFGCVSISREHSELAQAFLSDSMMESFRAEQEYLVDVKPIAPLKVKGKVWTAEILSSLSSIAVINKLFGLCDPGKSIPVLLRHYLALNGRFVCFTVNKGFNDSLDGLILVDLFKTPKKYLHRYLGKEGAEDFYEYWQKNGRLLPDAEVEAA